MTDVLQKEELDLSGALISMNRMLVILEPVRKKLYESERYDKNALDLAKTIDVNEEEERRFGTRKKETRTRNSRKRKGKRE